MGRAGIVVDADRQTRRGGGGGEMREDLVLRQRRLRDRREQQPIGTQPFGIAR